MKTRTWLQGISSLFLAMTLILSIAQPGLAASTSAQPVDGNAVYDPATGALAFIGSEPGRAMASLLANPSAASPASNATAFTSTYASQMGLKDVSAELTLTKASTEPGGRSTVRYQQTYRGIPVFGGDVIVNTNAQGAMLSLTAKTSPNLKVDITPTLTAEQAIATAIPAIAKYNDLNAASLTAVGTPKLQIYDSRLLNPDGIPPRLVWNMVVSAPADGISEVALVDAHNGAIVLHYSQVESAALPPNAPANASGVKQNSPAVLGSPQIAVYTLNHAAPSPGDVGSWPGTWVCDQSDTTNCDGVGGDDPDATNAYLNALDAYNFMKTYLGIDSIDNAGATINSSIHYGTAYKKDFWITGLHIVAYGDGHPKADDMAGHAISLGILENSPMSSVALAYQPGAVAESLADMWGEFIDQTNKRGNDTAAVKWVIGEDWPEGPQRNMKTPSIAPFHHPDKMTSQYYYLGDGGNGIFINAGVNNKAVYLMTDGATFNGKTVKGLGIKKVANIYYEAETHLLASASNYFDLYYAVKQACYNLVGSYGIVAQDCDQVRSALDAVEMNSTKSSTVYPVAAFCPPGKSKSNSSLLFFDSLENGTGKWTLTNPSSSSNPLPLWAPVADNATDGFYHFEGPEPATASQAIAETTNAIPIPAGYPIYLFFEHWFNFETLSTNYYDGGFLQYSIDDGVTWKHTAFLYASGQNYNGVIASGRGNPQAGQKAFVHQVLNYVSTTFNLSALAGMSVKFRWIMASDASGPGSGWYVDNIQIYRCLSLPGIPTLLSPAMNFLNTDYKPTLTWSSVFPDLDHYVLQIATDTTFATPVYEVSTTSPSHTVLKALAPNLKYYWRVRAYNQADDAQNWSAVHYFRTSLRAPVLKSPIGTSPNLRPVFDWTDAPGAQGYTIQVSLVPTFVNLYINATLFTPKSTFTPTKTLLSGKTYYWRVRTNGTNGPSAWATQTFVTP
ncbi:MAG: M4 family metallopeptidase [Anaerolineales bacterium]